MRWTFPSDTNAQLFAADAEELGIWVEADDDEVYVEDPDLLDSDDVMRLRILEERYNGEEQIE